MHARIWPLMLSLVLLAGCAAPSPDEETPSAAEESKAAPEPPAEAEPGRTLADESFESGRSETLRAGREPCRRRAGRVTQERVGHRPLCALLMWLVVVGLCPTRSSGCAARILTMGNRFSFRR